MADNFLQFSEMLPDLTVGETAWLDEQLQPIVVFGDREFAEDDPVIATMSGDPEFSGPRFLRDNPHFDGRYDLLGFEFAFEDDHGSRGLWLHADDYGDLTHVAWLVHKFLKRFRPDQCWSLSYSNSCSKPRIGGFSGGAVFVTAAEIEQYTADDWVQQQRAALKARENEPAVTV